MSQFSNTYDLKRPKLDKQALAQKMNNKSKISALKMQKFTDALTNIFVQINSKKSLSAKTESFKLFIIYN